jgi:glycosyltransferase involved in cell wall biosynthesis
MSVIGIVHEHRNFFENPKSWGGYSQYPMSVRTAIFENHPIHPATILVKNGDSIVTATSSDTAQIHWKRMLGNIARSRNTAVLNLAKKQWQSKTVEKILKSYDRNKPTIIWHQMNGFELPGIEFLKISKIANIKLVTTSHDMQDAKYPHFFTEEQIESRRISYKINYLLAQRIFTSSEFGRQEIIDFLGIDEDKIVVAPHGHSQITRLFKFEKNKDETCKFFLFPAKAWPHKGHVELIEQILEMPSCNFKVIFIGDLSPIASELRTLKNHRNFGDRILDLGYVSNELKQQLIMKCSGFVLPSIYEGFGYPYLEAAAAFKPILTFETEAVLEIFNPNNLIAVEVGDYAGLTSKMQAFSGTSDKKLKENFNISKNYTWSNTAQIYLDSYSQVVLS